MAQFVEDFFVLSFSSVPLCTSCRGIGAFRALKIWS